MGALFKNEQGSILLYVLLLLTLMGILGTAMMSVSVLENKMSNYSVKAEKSYCLADAGNEVGAELIYELLAFDYSNQEDLPEEVTLEKNVVEFGDNGKQKALVKEIKKEYQDADYCIYSLKVTGNYYGIEKKVETKIKYIYTEYYYYSFFEDGSIASKTFEYRILDNRGDIISYNLD